MIEVNTVSDWFEAQGWTPLPFQKKTWEAYRKGKSGFVNAPTGSGKTTTAGKLASQFKEEGKSVMLVACDTFRAAAVEQLKTWGERVGAKVVYGADGGDSGDLDDY